MMDFYVELVEVHLLVNQWIGRVAAAGFDVFRELDHLVHGLLAREPADELFDDQAQVVFALAGLGIPEDVDHHGHHYVHPAGANQRDSAVEIKEDDPGVLRGSTWAKLFNHFFNCGTKTERPQIADKIGAWVCAMKFAR